MKKVKSLEPPTTVNIFNHTKKIYIKHKNVQLLIPNKQAEYIRELV